MVQIFYHNRRPSDWDEITAIYADLGSYSAFSLMPSAPYFSTFSEMGPLSVTARFNKDVRRSYVLKCIIRWWTSMNKFGNDFLYRLLLIVYF